MGKTILVGVIAGVIGILCGFFLGIVFANYQIFEEDISISSEKTVETEQNVDRAEYIENYLEIYKVSAKWSKTFRGKEAYVTGKIRNNGNQSVQKVEAIIYYLDSNGNALFEETCYLVLSDGYFSDEPPLKPNYIESFVSFCEDCPSEWAEGKIRIAIVDIEFE